MPFNLDKGMAGHGAIGLIVLASDQTIEHQFRHLLGVDVVDCHVDAVFISCTGLQAAAVVGEIEAVLGKPVTSSNHALAWHCLRLAGIDDPRHDVGKLFELDLAGEPRG